MATERRLTMHNGRAHKGGKVFSSKHNDHLQENGEWDVTKREDCWFWKSKNCPGETFDEGEKAFYEKFLRKTLDEQNERHRASRHEERVKTIDQYRASRNYCPEETIYYLGDKEHQVPKEKLKEVVVEFTKWHQKTYPLCAVLNLALHADEKGADHIQARKVWMAKNENGDWIVNQNKSLEQMGVERPNPNEKTGTKNNAKMTYTANCRQKLFEIAKEKGVELIEEPRPKSSSGKSLSQYIEDKLEKKEKELAEQVEELKAANEEDKVEFEDRKAIIGDLRQDLIKSANKEFKDDLGAKLKATSIIRECIQRALEKLGIIKARVDERTEKIRKIEPAYKMNLELPDDLEDEWER